MILKEITINVLTSGMSEDRRRVTLEEIQLSRLQDNNLIEKMEPDAIFENSCELHRTYLKGAMEFSHPEQLRVLLPFIENLPAYGKFLSHNFIRAAAAILEKTHTDFAIVPEIRSVDSNGKPDFDFEKLLVIR